MTSSARAKLRGSSSTTVLELSECNNFSFTGVASGRINPLAVACDISSAGEVLLGLWPGDGAGWAATNELRSAMNRMCVFIPSLLAIGPASFQSCGRGQLRPQREPAGASAIHVDVLHLVNGTS